MVKKIDDQELKQTILKKRQNRYLKELKKSTKPPIKEKRDIFLPEHYVAIQRQRLKSDQRFKVKMQKELVNPEKPRIPETSKIFLVIRIREFKDMSQKINKTLQSFGLNKLYSAVFLSNNVFNTKILNAVEDFVTYGEPSIQIIRSLFEKRGKIWKKHSKKEKGTVPLNNNLLIEKYLKKYDIICLEDLIYTIYNVDDHFNDAIEFICPFELNKPTKELNVWKTFWKGGDCGYRGQKINELTEMMN